MSAKLSGAQNVLSASESARSWKIERERVPKIDQRSKPFWARALELEKIERELKFSGWLQEARVLPKFSLHG